MKTIEIQNCTHFKDRSLKVIVNEKTHLLRHQFLTIHVADDKLFEIKVKYFWDGSPAYTFEPKNNLSLQISQNQRMINWSLVLLLAGLVLSFVIGYFYENGRFIAFAPIIAPLFVAIYYIIRWKKFFVIKEINS
jgi:hypothetical protein